ncbi:hypothetical protein [Streptomyces qinglanensis]|uniref:Uncharacterized protein n=1 Tax=Streptomyces qinglanensis TaxID=943816 RepID=A0A1H9VRX9_9ACTN|nr:hypothetical protein [Streptomyces qinglanensis]SES24301.1 hypothetical protein SAMN05421870_11346 [Streptomyces qinglanensis]
MKSTATMRNIANPRRTTLAHLKDADPVGDAGTLDGSVSGLADSPEAATTLPERTANPRRTTLVDAPAG